MIRRSYYALAVAIALFLTVSLFTGPPRAEAQCLNRAACAEIKAEVAKLKPDFRRARLKLKKVRMELKRLEPGSDPWTAKRAELRRIKKTFKALKRELRALKRDFRHQACAGC